MSDNRTSEQGYLGYHAAVVHLQHLRQEAGRKAAQELRVVTDELDPQLGACGHSILLNATRPCLP